MREDGFSHKFSEFLVDFPSQVFTRSYIRKSYPPKRTKRFNDRTVTTPRLKNRFQRIGRKLKRTTSSGKYPMRTHVTSQFRSREFRRMNLL